MDEILTPEELALLRRFYPRVLREWTGAEFVARLRELSDVPDDWWSERDEFGEQLRATLAEERKERRAAERQAAKERERAERRAYAEAHLDEIAFKGLPVTWRDVLELEAQETEERRLGRNSARLICACGHSLARHRQFEGMTPRCQPSSMSCPCKLVRPVVLVSNSKWFVRKTTGVGSRHALGLGLAALEMHGGTWEWVEGEGVRCDRCSREVGDGEGEGESGGLLPVAVRRWGPAGENGLPRERQCVGAPAAFNNLFCAECLDEEGVM